MNIKFHRDGDDVDIALFDINGPVAQYTVPLRALISALPEDLLNEFWRPQLDDALAQVDNLRAGLAETSRDADRIAEQRDEAQRDLLLVAEQRDKAREEAAGLRAGMEDMRVHSNRMATQRDEVRRQLTEARDLNVTLTRERDEAREGRDQASRMAADLASERDDLRRQVAIMESQWSRAIAECDDQRRSIRALLRTIKELTS